VWLGGRTNKRQTPIGENLRIFCKYLVTTYKKRTKCREGQAQAGVGPLLTLVLPAPSKGSCNESSAVIRREARNCPWPSFGMVAAPAAPLVGPSCALASLSSRYLSAPPVDW
jgi:hypothetical protein